MTSASPPASSATDAVKRARALQPLVRDAADEAERERRLPARVAEAMAREGLYRVAAPRAIHGAEADPETQIRVIEAIAEADGAAGWNLMIGIESLGLLASGFPRSEELFGDPMGVFASSSAAVGKALRCEGGYQMSGQWPFVSGCHNADWFAGIVALHENGEPIPGPPHYAIVRRGDFEILDTWRVSGLRGSGSHDVKVDGAFVRSDDTFPLVPGARPREGVGGTVARVPLGARLAYNKVGVSLGLARAGIDAFVDLATGKVPYFTSTTLRERADAQAAVADAEARVRSGRAFVFERVGALWETALAGDEVSKRDRALLQLACSDAVRGCAEAVDRVVEAAGTSANRLDSPLERIARDVRVVRQHTTVAPHHTLDAGRVLLGLDPEGLMLGTLG